MAIQPGSKKVNYIRSAQVGSIADIARRVALQITPTLRDAKGFKTAALAIGKAAVGPATLVKDIAGAGGAIYDAARANERIAGQARALAGAAAHSKVAGQIGFDLVRARIAVSQAEEIGRTFKSPAAESALVFMRPELQKLQSAFESERIYMHKYREIAVGLNRKIGGATSSRLGEFALAAEKVASKSSVGRSIIATRRVLSYPWIAHSLVALGIGIASFNGYVEAETNSKAWKFGYGAGAGFTSGVADLGLAEAVAARGTNPAALLYDPVVKYGPKALGYGKLGDRLQISTFYEDCSKLIVSFTQALTTGDLEPMNAVHSRLMNGNGHLVLQGYASIGEVLSKSALIDAARTRAADWHSAVPDEFKTSPSWWSALKSDACSVMDFRFGFIPAVVKSAVTAIGEKLGISEPEASQSPEQKSAPKLI